MCMYTGTVLRFDMIDIVKSLYSKSKIVVHDHHFDSTMLLLEANVPEFLQSSPYLQSLLSNGPFPEEGLEIPDGSGKQDLSVTSKADLIELLSTLRFWLVPEVAEQSSGLLRFAFSSASQKDFVEVATEFRNDIPLVDELFQIVNCDEENRLKMAAGFGRLVVFQCIHVQGIEIYSDVMEAAACGGHFECTQYIADNNPTEIIYFKQLACARAAKHGHFTCVKRMLKDWGTEYSSVSIVGAATGNQFEILTYTCGVGHDQSCVYEAMKKCVANGHLECLEYLYSLGYEKDVELIEFCGKHLNCLKFLVEHNYPGIVNICSFAAEYGRLECLKYAHELGMPWDEFICSVAAQGGHLACLQYAREHGCPWWDEPAEEDLPVNNRNKHCTNRIRVAVDLINYYDDEELIAASACEAPTIDCLLYVLEQGAALSPLCATKAASSKSLATLQFLHARGFTWEAEDCVKVIISGSLDCLQFLHDLCTPWDSNKLEITAVNNIKKIDSPEYEILEYLLEQACPCLTAAKCGNLESLQYAHEHGDLLTSEVCRQAATIECYEYAVAHGCPGAELNTQFYKPNYKRKLRSYA